MTNAYHQFLGESFIGESLTLLHVNRKQMGTYLCIASNDVPPAVSKRITLNINCKYNFCTFIHYHLILLNILQLKNYCQV